MSTDPFITSLNSKCSPSPYDQALFLSQKIVNDGFNNMWLLADPTSPMRSVSIKTRDGSNITGILNAPTVIVNVVDFTAMLYFQWNFKSGSMTLYTTDDPNNPSTVTFKVDNWTVAFTTSLSRTVIPPSDPSHASYCEQMGVDPNSDTFSLARLYIESQGNAGYYAPGSNFQDTNWADQTEIVQSHFETLRQVWVDQMSDQGCTQLAVMLQTSEPTTVNPLAPTFPPSTIDHASYPWRDPVDPQPPSNSSDANAIAYLIMTNNDTPVDPPAIPYSGTWVDTSPSEPGRGAILCMKTEQFWESWLLPLLQTVNLATQIQPTTPDVAYIGSDTWQIQMNYTPGLSSQHPNVLDDYYKFTKGSDQKSWTWTADPSLLTSQKSVDANSTTYTMNEYATATTKVTFAEGGQAIQITGNNTVGMKTHSTGDFESDSAMSFTMSYTLNYALTRVDDGSLQILHTSTPQVANGPVQHSQSSGQTWTPPLQDYGTDLQQAAFSTFTNALGAYQKALEDSLAGIHKLILPGGGSFLCYNVAFTNAGDLITNLYFNGATSKGQVPRLPDFLRDAPPRQISKEFTPTPPVPFPSMSYKVIPGRTKRQNRVY